MRDVLFPHVVCDPCLRIEVIHMLELALGEFLDVDERGEDEVLHASSLGGVNDVLALLELALVVEVFPAARASQKQVTRRSREGESALVGHTKDGIRSVDGLLEALFVVQVCGDGLYALRL